MSGRFVFVGASCAVVIAAACTGDDAIFSPATDAGSGDVAVSPTPVPTPPPARPDAPPKADAAPPSDASSDGPFDASPGDATTDASGDAGPPSGLGPDGVFRGTTEGIDFSFTARLPSTSALCPAYATIEDTCCVWSARVKSPARVPYSYGLQSGGKITIDGFEFASLPAQIPNGTPPAGIWPQAQITAAAAGFEAGRFAWPRYLELVHKLAGRYGTPTDPQRVRDLIDKGLLTSLLFSADLTGHSIGWYPNRQPGGQLYHHYYVSGPDVRVNQAITTPSCQTTFSSELSNFSRQIKP